ncbi:MAG: winged helix-turn-helix transcriptional regulator [Methanobacteriota archaeon]|nr:MAG: winged helix-turn-helix transcriptional regulator [Euryarchaeota archaeon]
MPMQTSRTPSQNVLDEVSFVLSSRQREKVLASLIPGPKTPVQVARHTGLRLPHVSRTLRQLLRSDLVRSSGNERRGKLYLPTSLGVAVFTELMDARGDRLVAPLVRGSHFKMYHHWLSKRFGRQAADGLLFDLGLDPSTLDGDGWYPLRTAMECLDLIESRFGDGTYETIRTMLREEIASLSSTRRLLRRLLPVPIIIELSPNAYNREFNHGRLEVEIQGQRALMKNFDWMSSPARCAAWLGSYEGSMAMLGVEGKVRKVACVLRGDTYCGYTVDW